MAKYTIYFSPRAEKSFKKIDMTSKRKMATAIDNLTHEPRPNGSRKIVGSQHYYRIRVNNYRIIYEIQDRQLIILIFDIGHRKDIYRKFKQSIKH